MFAILQQKRHCFALLALCFVGLLVLAQPAAAQCAVGQQGGPAVFYQGCTEATGNDATSVIIPAEPAGYTAGDMMLLAISTDGSTDPTPADSSGWTELNTLSTQGVTLSLWYRLSATTAGANRTFNFGTNEAFVATYMRFTNAESILAAYASNATATPQAPALTTDRDNSLVLRLSAKDWRDTNLNGGLTQITSSAAGTGNSGVDTAIGFVNVSTSGTNLPAYNFSTSQSDGWHAATIAIRPPKPAVAFRITHGGSNGSTCTSTLFTFTAVNEDGGAVTGYTGALTIGSPAGLGNWSSVGDEVGGTFSNGTVNDGTATYTMVAGDLGTVAFNYIPNRSGPMTATVTAGALTQSSHPQGSTQLLNVDACGFTISHDGTHGTCAIAGYQEILITAVQSDGSTLLPDYTGTIRINTPGVSPTWSISIPDGEAYGTLTVVDPFTVEYTFDDDAGDGDGADNGQVTLRFDYDFPATVNFDFIETLNPGVNALLGTDQQLAVTACGFSISHDLTGATCAYEIITLASNVPGNTETITVTTSSTAGVWVPESAAGTFTPQANGNFQYVFASGDNNSATFRLYHAITSTVTFDVSGSDGGVQVGDDDPLEFGLCEFVITANASGNNCTPNNVTVKVVDQAGATVSGYTGTVTLSTDSGVGIWQQGSATNVPNNSPTSGDGAATLAFAVADAGTVSLQLDHADPVSVQLDANDSAYSIVTPSKPSINILACKVWVSIVSDGDVCTPSEVGFEIRDTAGTLIRNYVGTLTITATTANGDWSLGGATSTATFTNNGDGEAVYGMSLTSGGSVTLTFTDTIVEAPKFLVEDSAGLLAVDAGHNPTLNNEACKFLISHNGPSDLCTPAAVTFSLVNSNGDPVNDYEGKIFITTSFSGTWADGTTTGIVDTGNGAANYQFVAPNTGTATFSFQGLTINDYDIDVTDGSNTDNDGNASDDPNLEFTACLPTITNFSCVNAATTSITLPSSEAALGTRAVVMVTGNEGITAITNAQFNGVSASAGGQLLSVANNTNPSNQRTITEMFTWLDSELPAAGGSYSGTFSVDDGQAMCLIALKNVNQSYPAGAQLGSAFGDGGTIQSSLTSPAADSIIISGATVDENDGTFSVNTLGNQLANISVADDAWTFSAGYGTTAGTGTVTVTETFSGTVDKWTHAIAAFAPAPAPLSYFRITHDGSTTACTMQQVTIAAYDLNGNIKNDYTGTITITTSTNHGTWSQSPASGTLTENPLDDNGTATYQFAASDNGSVTLNLLVPHNETLSLNVTGDGKADDNTHATLVINSCEPIISATQCYAGTSGSIDIVGTDTSAARAVVMSIARESTVGNDPAINPNLVLFDTGGTPMTMTLVVNAKVNDGTFVNTTEMYVIFDDDLPSAAGTYNASFTELSGTFPNTPAMCLTAFYGVAQTVPVAPAVAASTSVVTVTPASVTTTVTTTGNNALVLSVVSDDRAGGTYTSDLETTLWNNETPPTSAVFSGFSGLKPQAGPIDDTVVPSGTPGIISHIMASFAPVVAGPPTADGFVPVTLFKTFSGPVNYRAYGSSYRTLPNGNNAEACTFVDAATGTSINVDVPADSTFKGAYLYWSGGGDTDIPAQIDTNVTLVRGTTETFTISADETFLIENIGTNNNLDYFTGFKDVSTIVTSNGTYTLRDMVSQNGSPWQDTSACAAGWALVVVYENTLEDIQVINLFHGYQPLQNSSFNLVPRNFRMHALDVANSLPHGQFTHISIEGDNFPASLNTVNERLGLQAAPGSATFNYLTNSFNPPSAQYNSTVTRPIYDASLNWLSTAGVNSDGYEALSTTSYGVDVDTYFLRGDTVGTPLYEFGIANPLPEEITTQFSAGQDLVLLVGEVIGVTNEPIVDLEVTLTEGQTFVAGGTSSYTISLKNNGDGAGLDGSMTGSATVTLTLPSGLTVITGTVTATGWNCVINNSPPANPLGLAALACEYNINTPLAEGGSLPSITVPVAIGDESFFPNLVNQEEVVVRALYHGGNCSPDPLDDSLADFGTSPDPDECRISPRFDNVQDLEGGALSMNDLEEKAVNNNNIDRVNTTINGRRTDLQLTKVAGVFQESSAATYTITVTNLGPQSATRPITVTDTLPAGLTYTGKLETGDNDAWSCSAVGQIVTCTTNTDLAPADTADFLLGVVLSAPAIENANISNTACVSIAAGNFDTNSANNCDTEAVTVQGEPVGGQNKFLISVNQSPTSLGAGTGTLSFNVDDIILFDPLTDVATMFFDDSADNSDGLQDINAFHLRTNGHFILSTVTGTSTIGIGSNQVSFEPGDLVVYDPLLKSATMLFDGSAHFDSATTNIDAVFERADGQLVISTTDSASMHAGTAWERGDFVLFNPTLTTPTATIFLDGQSNIFTADVQLNGLYLRAGSTPDYVITIGQSNATIAPGSTAFTGDDIASIQPDAGTSALEFRGSIPNGVFDPLSSSRFIDGVHIVENGYFGHFSITESVSGSTCTPTTIVIRKHDVNHNVDTSYTGSIRIDIDYGGAITWSKIDGDGTLQATGSGNQYIYTFVPSDNGEVTLSLTVTQNGTDVNIDVSNGLVVEDASEDPTVSFNDVVSAVTYGDNFSSGGFTGNSGSSNFESAWVETDADGLGAGTGNVQIIAGEAYFDNVPNAQTLADNMPALVREVDFSQYTAGTLTLTFDWRTVSVNSGDSFIVEARGDKDSDSWLTVGTFTGLTGTNSGSESYNLSSILSGGGQSLSANTQVRFRVNANYNVSGNFILDDVVLSTTTTNCGVGAVHHYEITHVGYGVMCEAYQITFQAHDVAHTPIAPALNTVVNLSTSVGKGSWSALPAYPNLADTTLGDGLATYTFPLNQNSFSANFNLTNPVTPTETIHFNIAQGAITELGSPGGSADPYFTFAESGFIFTNAGGSQTIGVQIAGKRSNLAPSNGIYLRAVDTNLDTLDCEALFGGQTVQVEMQVQCTNPSSCATTGATINGTVVPENDNYIPGPGGTTDTNVAVTFGAGSQISNELVFNYPDAGEVQIHAEYEIPINNDPDGNTEGGYMRGSSQPFVVRPFGFRFDLSANTDPFSDDGTADDSFGNPVATGSDFVKAGEAFTINLQAIRYLEGAGQDDDQDGHPDLGVDLSSNGITPNFGSENSPSQWPVATITHTVTLPTPANNGALSGTITFNAFSGGQDTNNDISFNEVGIIDIAANLVGDYLDSGETLRGYVRNVGRFTPDHYYYHLTTSSHINRIALNPFCSPASTFTYMGEPLQLTVDIDARNREGDITRNYYAGFQRLTGAPAMFTFSATDVDTMDLLSGRLDVSAMDSMTWNNTFGNGDTGEGTLTGNIVFTKDSSPDGPYSMMTVGMLATDSDGVTVRTADYTLDLPPSVGTDTITVLTTAIRYGRLTINDTGGSDISISATPGAGEDIPITFDLEYYDSATMNFLVNALDDCTTLSSSHFSIVPDAYTDDLTDNVSGIGTVTASPTISVSIQSPTITVLENGSTRSTSSGTDVPFYLSSPLPADSTTNVVGSLIIELNLDAAVDVNEDMTDDVTYDYLKFDWRSPSELYDETQDGTEDNPRAIIDFGTFQGHSRVINWQEILLTPE